MNAPPSIWRSALSLATVAVIGTALLSGVNALTAKRIAEQERAVVLKQLAAVLDPGGYDNALQNDVFEFRDELYFPGGQTVTAYRTRLQDKPAAIILRFAAVKGYNGKIHLLAGIRADGQLTGVRVVAHKETPGLGDLIESTKSDWLNQFPGRSLQDPEPAGWSVQRDGGEFDQFTGATISPRAVVEAVEKALRFYQDNADYLFDSPSMIAEQEAE